LNCRALKQKTNEKKGFDHLFSNDFIITIIISHVGLFYFWNLNGSSVPPLALPLPPKPRPFFARCLALSLSVLPSFYFFSLSKKNTSKFQNETNENKKKYQIE
jgi:hypothetical protein